MPVKLTLIDCEKPPLQDARHRREVVVATVGALVLRWVVAILVAALLLSLAGCSRAEAEPAPAPVVAAVPFQPGTFVCRCEPLDDLGRVPLKTIDGAARVRR